ncbi:hypothetical protein EVAR_87393_1 [Eumeta japonica]|uniref:Uncharacterized protein n=1 Tax=Eumeta variegata TaxID=151549 RepID=A0A4C1Y155_EUMVA|nr:hypothetical protein EVAR_87393_1 [Eumeta japonica]
MSAGGVGAVSPHAGDGHHRRRPNCERSRARGDDRGAGGAQQQMSLDNPTEKCTCTVGGGRGAREINKELFPKRISQREDSGLTSFQREARPEGRGPEGAPKRDISAPAVNYHQWMPTRRLAFWSERQSKMNFKEAELLLLILGEKKRRRKTRKYGLN